MTGEVPQESGGTQRRVGLTRRGGLRALAGAASGGAALALAACGAGQQAGTQPSKSVAPAKLVWAFWGNQDQVDVRQRVFDEIPKKYPQLTIDKIWNTGGLDDHFAKVQVLVSSGNGLDLFMSSPIWVPNLADRSLYRPLDQLMARDKFPVKEWSDAALSAFNFKGKQYAMPETLNFAVIAYNLDLFAKAGEKPPAAEWTWDDFVATAQRLKGRTGENTWAVGPVNADLNNTLPWIWSNGGKIFDDEQDPKRSTFNTAAVTEAVQWRADWAYRLGIAPKAGEITQPGDAFVNGLLAMGVTTLTNFPTWAKSITSFKWDVVQIPKGKGGRVNFVGASGQGITSSSKNVDQAWLALQYQASKEGLLPYMTAQWGVPPLVSLAKQDYLQLPPPPANRRAVVDGIATLRALPKMPAMLELYSQVYGAELGNIYSGKRTARDAAVDIDTQVQNKLTAK